MSMSFKKRKVWLEIAFFSGAFLSVFGFIAGYESCVGFFPCSTIVNNVPIALYQEFIIYLGIALFISSIGLMYVGEAGTGGHFPSRRAMLDFAFIMGTFVFVSGFGAFFFLCALSCWAYSYEFGLPLMLMGASAAGSSLYFLNNDCKINATNSAHIFRWELLAIGSMVVLLVSEFTTPLNWQTIIPILEFDNVTPEQLGFVFLSLAGMIIGLHEIKKNQNRNQRKPTTTMIVKQVNAPLAKRD
jgi:hypothetical protein